MKDLYSKQIAQANKYLYEIGAGHYFSMIKLYRYLLFNKTTERSIPLRAYQVRIDKRASIVLNNIYTFFFYFYTISLVLGYVLKKILSIQLFMSPAYVIITNFLFLLVVLPLHLTKKTFRESLFIQIVRRFPSLSILAVKRNFFY